MLRKEELAHIYLIFVVTRMNEMLSKSRVLYEVLETEGIQCIILSSERWLSVSSLLNVDRSRAELKAETFLLENRSFHLCNINTL